MRIKYLVTLGAITPLVMAGVVYAATTPSAYATDVQNGQAQIKSDSEASSKANEVKDGENVEGQVDDGQVEVQEQVEPQEATEPAESGDSAKGQSDSSSRSTNGTSGNESPSGQTSPTSPTVGTNQ
jgi:hypothetical protein